MAGKIIADTLEHSTAGSVTTDYVVNGSAKAWINFNGTGTIATKDSFAISTLTDSGTGKYDIAYSSSFANANYAISVEGNNPDGNDDGNQKIVGLRKSNTKSSSMTPIHSGDWFYASSAILQDSNDMYLISLGDLA